MVVDSVQEGRRAVLQVVSAVVLPAGPFLEDPAGLGLRVIDVPERPDESLPVDLSVALSRTEQGIHNFYSPYDLLISSMYLPSK